MTTGRINQVTIAGRRRREASDGRSTRSRGRRAHVIQTEQPPRSYCKASLTHCQRGGRPRAWPVASHSGTVNRSRQSINTITSRSHAKRCNPLKRQASRRKEHQCPLPSQQRHTQNCRASREVLPPERKVGPHAAPQQQARQDVV